MERWKRISDSPYDVSNMGRVRLNRSTRTGTRAGQILKPELAREGYLRICLYCVGGKPRVGIHVLVARAFVPNPKKMPEVNHKDTDKTNNRARNLEWTTRSGNQIHALLLRRHRKGYRRLPGGRWTASIQTNGKRTFLGYFGTEREVKVARRNAEKKFWGQFSKRAISAAFKTVERKED